MIREVRFSDLSEVESELDRLVRAKAVQTSGTWSFSQILNHIAEAIEQSMSKYPMLLPAVIRKTLGQWSFSRMTRRGFMAKGIFNPNAPRKFAEGDSQAAMKRLRKALKTFREYNGSMAVHPLYDQLKKSDFEKLHTMHIANHLSYVEPVDTLASVVKSRPESGGSGRKSTKQGSKSAARRVKSSRKKSTKSSARKA